MPRMMRSWRRPQTARRFSSPRWTLRFVPTAGGGPAGTFAGLTNNLTNNTQQNSCVSPSRPGPC